MSSAASTTPDELDALLRELDEIPATDQAPTPAGSTDERASKQDALELAAMGRPGLSGRPGAGPSPKRQVRLSKELDAALTARALLEHRNASDIIRDALDSYLRAAA
ncbi:gamma-glutamyltransferase [Microbacterium sp. CH12i]|nr:gamma-glutamyltransferase [Microbacterium sp. CH12i]